MKENLLVKLVGHKENSYKAVSLWPVNVVADREGRYHSWFFSRQKAEKEAEYYNLLLTLGYARGVKAALRINENPIINLN